MAKKPTVKAKPYWKMTTEELAEATKEFDQPLPPEKMRPLTKAERARWNRARRVGKDRGVSRVTVELPSSLFHRVADYARQHDLSVSEVMKKSLDSALTFAE
jgi:hypothetical protein